MSPRGPKPGSGAGGQRPGAGRIPNIDRAVDALRRATRSDEARARLSDDELAGCLTMIYGAAQRLEAEQERRPRGQAQSSDDNGG